MQYAYSCAVACGNVHCYKAVTSLAKLVRQISALHVTRRFMTVFTTAHHTSLGSVSVYPSSGFGHFSVQAEYLPVCLSVCTQNVQTALEVERQRRVADHSPPSSTEIKNKWSDTPTSPICLYDMHKDNVTFTDSELWTAA
jgi:hypothetical protein